jgi:hypothetical protein
MISSMTMPFSACRAAVAVELPGVLRTSLDHVEVEVGDDQLVLVARALGDDLPRGSQK